MTDNRPVHRFLPLAGDKVEVLWQAPDGRFAAAIVTLEGAAAIKAGAPLPEAERTFTREEVVEDLPGHLERLEEIHKRMTAIAQPYKPHNRELGA